MIKSKICISIIFIMLLMIATNNYGQQSSTEMSFTPKRLTNIQNAYPVLSPDGKKIIFQSQRTGFWEIYVMDVDGKNLVQLTNDKGGNGPSVWSPDGTKILFSSHLHDPTGDVYVMNADGSNVKRLTNTPGNDGLAKWSPDGTRIVFTSARTTPDLKVEWSRQIFEIFSMNADGSDVKQLSNLKTISTYASYSPDGTKIVFRGIDPTPGLNWAFSPTVRNTEIFVMNADGTNPVNITNSAAYDGWCTWSPDGKKILFSSNRAGPANIGQLFTMNPDGTDVQQITFGPGSFVQSSWSVDGKKILAQQHCETEEFSNLVIFDVN